MGYLRSLRENWDDRDWWTTNVRGFLLKHSLGRYYDLMREDGFEMMQADWDHLVILDACRYDLFERVNQVPGDLRKVRSEAASTEEFLSQYFAGQRLHDTVYVTANPQEQLHLDEGVFHTISRVWLDGWDADRGTVTPEVMASRCIEAADEYPNKRIIAHFMQPHIPFLGPTASEFDTEGELTPARTQALGDGPVGEFDSVWMELRRKEVSERSVWRAYRENLELVLEAVEQVIAEVDGKIVITSDHGNLINDRLCPFPIRESGHHSGLYVPELIDVPWLEIEGSRREIRSDTPELNDEIEADVAGRLRRLGYIE
ncbi:MAG: hypothetical protein V5A27_01370 [Halapricum sp.]